jgi:hypothetical protein
MLRNLFAVAALSLPVCAFAADENTVFDVPKLSNVTIDGKSDDWGDHGLKVGDLADTSQTLPAKNRRRTTSRLLSGSAGKSAGCSF